jgi:hypothetical protein
MAHYVYFPVLSLLKIEHTPSLIIYGLCMWYYFRYGFIIGTYFSLDGHGWHG